MIAAEQIVSSGATPAVDQRQIQALKAAYAKDGYAIIPGVVSPERLAALHQAIQDKFESDKASGKLFNGGGLFTGHLNCFPGEESRFVYTTLQERGVIDLIKEIFPGATRMPNVGLNFNLPGSIAQHYHADRPFTQEFIICNIAVVDTVIENGAIDLLPGTQKKFYPYWRFTLERAPSLTKRIEIGRA